LRLNFIRRLGENIKIERILAETEYPVDLEINKPDIIIHVKNDDGSYETVVFEMKFFSDSFPKCKKDLEKLEKYRLMGWDKGYFLAIDFNGVCEKITKELEKMSKNPPYIDNPNYKISGYASSEEYGGLCNTTFFKDLIKLIFYQKHPSIAINEINSFAIAHFKDYGFLFYVSDDKLIAIAGFKENQGLSIELVKKAGYQLVTINEALQIIPSEVEPYVLIKEVTFTETIMSDYAADQLEGPVNEFIKKMDAIKSELII